MNGTQLVLIGCGALVGLGVFGLARAVLVVEQPQLADALARLDRRPAGAAVPAPPIGVGGDAWAARAGGRLGGWAVATLVRAGTRIPAQQLTLIGWTPEGFLLRKLALAALGVVFVPLATGVLGLGGIRLPLLLPAAASVALAVALFFAPDLDVRGRAAQARAQLRRALCSYLDLVSLRRDASEGPTIALERAAAVGDGWAFGRIRDALVAARLSGESPWDGLRRLAADTGVSELGDVADIAEVAAVEGAAIAPTLRARAESLRVELLTDEEASANEASEKLTAPVAALFVAYVVLLAYPFVTRILAT